MVMGLRLAAPRAAGAPLQGIHWPASWDKSQAQVYLYYFNLLFNFTVCLPLIYTETVLRISGKYAT